MKLLSYKNSDNIDVQFLDDYGYIKKHATYRAFKNGEIKNPYDKTIFGVGYLGEGKYNTGTSNNHTMEYYVWRSMLLRCYDEGQKHKHQSYFGISTVCEEWHNFQTFSEWFYENYYDVGNERLHIDKDILIPGNKIYYPEACILVPQRINMLFMNMKKKKVSGLPNGIRQTPNGKYHAEYNNQSLGTYVTVDEAYSAYANAKENKIKEVAEEYKNIIPEKLYRALYAYKVDMSNDKNCR